mmetsp:Transcript_31266/g.71974  ORF Transcript_31266/g.71974 Transcript_31266/m.71974 type:complete len:219 (-) Transcript_31266:980-1636(-)
MPRRSWHTTTHSPNERGCIVTIHGSITFCTDKQDLYWKRHQTPKIGKVICHTESTLNLCLHSGSTRHRTVRRLSPPYDLVVPGGHRAPPSSFSWETAARWRHLRHLHRMIRSPRRVFFSHLPFPFLLMIPSFAPALSGRPPSRPCIASYPLRPWPCSTPLFQDPVPAIFVQLLWQGSRIRSFRVVPFSSFRGGVAAVQDSNRNHLPMVSNPGCGLVLP